MTKLRRPVAFLVFVAIAMTCACDATDDSGDDDTTDDDSDDDDADGDDDLADDDSVEPCYADPGIEARIGDLLSQMTLAEKVGQMTGPPRTALGSVKNLVLPVEVGANERLGIPALRLTGSSRGAIIYGTAFPVSMARGASWDVDLEERVGEALGAELKAIGGNVLLAPTINLLRHPGWGRAQETYGEDPHHLGRFAVASVNGIQKNVMAEVKHYAANSIENDRKTIDVIVDERTLREIYLPHFRAAVDEACAASVMSSYNRVNGVYMGQNRELLRDILKDEWKFTGFVASDWSDGTRNTIGAANGGLDIEMPAEEFYGQALVDAVLAGDVDESVIDDAVTRILRMKFYFGLFDEEPAFEPGVLQSEEHTRLALEAARESIVLLKNESESLPLFREDITKVALVGPMADRARLGDLGSSLVIPKYAISPLEGLRGRAGDVEIVDYTGLDPTQAAALAAAADAVVVIAALTSFDEGEQNMPFGIPSGGGDRTDLGLHSYDVDIIDAVTAVNDRVVVVIEAGGAVTVEPWIGRVEAVLMAWYPGMEGGNAIADVLFGDVNPSGKMPFTTPHADDPMIEFGTGEPSVVYGYDHGYFWFDREGIEPRFPFGFGLSYSAYTYSNLDIDDSRINDSGPLTVRFDVTNVGSVAGKEIAQLYVSSPGAEVTRHVRDLKRFLKVELAAGETITVEFEFLADDLKYYDDKNGEWRLEKGTYSVEVGPSSRDLPLIGTFEIE